MIHGNACFAYFNKLWGIPGSTFTSGLRKNASNWSA